MCIRDSIKESAPFLLVPGKALHKRSIAILAGMCTAHILSLIHICFKHTGVFPEQAVNWAWYAKKIRAAGRPVKVLNLFGYTGGEMCIRDRATARP